ncbi:MAG: prepilin-type N-terminal cleavage/methylation domain-containing protein [Gemmatimonadaceae bacterium]
MSYPLSGIGRRGKGLTLIEVIITIAILAIIASIVYPIVFRKDAPPSAPNEAVLIDQAKALAVTRAETMRLTVARDGAWEIVAEATPNSVLASGQLAEAPPAAFAVRVTELGACLPADIDRRVESEGRVIDAVSCTIRP